MSDYISLQKKLLANYDKGLYQVKTEANKNDVDKIRKEIAYLDQGLSLTDTLYSDNPASLQKISTLQREYDALGDLQFNNQAAMCSALGNMVNPNSTELLADNGRTFNSYPMSSLTAQVGGG